MTRSILRKMSLLGAVASVACLSPSAYAGRGGLTGDRPQSVGEMPGQEGTADGLWIAPGETEGELRGVFRDEASASLFEIEAMLSSALPTVGHLILPTGEAQFGFLYGEVYRPATKMAPRELLGTFEGNWDETGIGSGHFFALLYHARLNPGQVAGVFEGDFRSLGQDDLTATFGGGGLAGKQASADHVRTQQPTPPPVQVPAEIQDAGAMGLYGHAPEGAGIDPTPWQASAVQGSGSMTTAGERTIQPDGSVHQPGMSQAGSMAGAGGMTIQPDGLVHLPFVSPTKSSSVAGGASMQPGGLLHQPPSSAAGSMLAGGGMTVQPGGLIHLPGDDAVGQAGGQLGAGAVASDSAAEIDKGEFQGRWKLFH